MSSSLYLVVDGSFPLCADAAMSLELSGAQPTPPSYSGRPSAPVTIRGREELL